MPLWINYTAIDYNLHEILDADWPLSSVFMVVNRSLREPDGPCTKSMEVSESRMERVNINRKFITDVEFYAMGPGYKVYAHMHINLTNRLITISRDFCC